MLLISKHRASSETRDEPAEPHWMVGALLVGAHKSASPIDRGGHESRPKGAHAPPRLGNIRNRV